MFDALFIFLAFALGFGAGHLANCIRIANTSTAFSEIVQGLKNAYDEAAAELENLKADAEKKVE